MPRWLSEGISVYEELERDAAWGQRMTPRYRALILGETGEGEGGASGLIPLSRLGGAFSNPESAEEMMFGYYLSSIAVEYFVESFVRRAGLLRC